MKSFCVLRPSGSRTRFLEMPPRQSGRGETYKYQNFTTHIHPRKIEAAARILVVEDATRSKGHRY